MSRRLLLVPVILIAPIVVGLALRVLWKYNHTPSPENRHPVPVGTIVDQEHGVAVRANGKSTYESHGKNFSDDGYYYGRRWQCVEFVKRYYYDRFQHRMPNGWGHAKSFFNPEVKQGEINTLRGLVQYRNGGNMPPKPGDLIVYDFGEFGHVAIVSKVKGNTVEIIQQNVSGHPRAELSLKKTSTGWTLSEGKNLTGWLRLPPNTSAQSQQ